MNRPKRPRTRASGTQQAVAEAAERFLAANPLCERCGRPATDVAIVQVPMPAKGDRGVRVAALCRRHADRERRRS